MIRRLIALLMLFSITYSSAESVIGVLRDGEVHHESMAAATLHASHDHDSHGHEDGSSPDSEHEHGTQADHCSHHHGTVLVKEPLVLELSSPAGFAPFLALFSWTDRFAEPSVDPPKA
jgi:hypothetical protein